MLLEIGREGEAGKPHEWSGEKALVIGRGRNAEMMISDPLLSRRHCQLEMSNGAVLVHDLGSANGTFINGIQATRAALAPGDVVTFGRSWLRIVPELVQVKIGGGGEPQNTQTTKRFDKRAAPTSPERRYDGATDPEGEAYPPIDGYELFGTIGKGSFGTVYRAKHRATGRIAAIKVIPTGASAKPENVARFLREIEATGQLQHPNLVAVHGAGEGPHFAYLIMEYVEGDTLARVIQRDGKLEPARSLEIGRQIAAGLEHAFSRGFVHRDVKPENILIDGGGTAKLCDFGLVKNLAASSGANLTRPGQGFGSLAYMPPEQVRDAARADQRADVYSLGATLYNALCGRRPFSGPVNKGFLRRVMEEYPDPIEVIVPGMPRDVITIVERCLQKDPALRYQSPRELREAIEACLRVASTGLEPALPSLRGASTDKGGGSVAVAAALLTGGAAPPQGGGVTGEGTAIGTGAATEARGAASTSAPAVPSSVSTTTNLPPYGSGQQPALVPAPSSLGSSGRLAPPLGPSPPLGAPTPATPQAQGAVNPASGRLYSTSDSDAFDDFAKDLAPIPTDSNPVMRLSEAARKAALAAGAAAAGVAPPGVPVAPPGATPSAPPSLAPSPAAELVLGLAATPLPGEITRAAVERAGPPTGPPPVPRTDPVMALFPGGDETRRTVTPPFLAIGKTGTPKKIESGLIPVADVDGDTMAPGGAPLIDTHKAPHVPKGRAAEHGAPGGPSTPPQAQGWPIAHPAPPPPSLAAGAKGAPPLRGPSLGDTLRAPPPAGPVPAVATGGNPFPETLRVPPPGGAPGAQATEARAATSPEGGAKASPGTSPVSRDTDPAMPPLVALPAKAPPGVEGGEAEAPRKEGLLGKITKRLFKGRGKAALLLAGSLALLGAALEGGPLARAARGAPPPDESSRDVDGRFLRMRLGGTPRGWKVERDDDLSRDAVAAIGSRLSIPIQRAAQSVYVVPQGRVALNTYLAPGPDEARKLERALRRPKGPAIVRDDRGIFELESPSPAALEEVLAHLPVGPAARTVALDDIRWPGSPIRRWKVEAHLVLLGGWDAGEVRRIEALLAQASGATPLSNDDLNDLARLAQKLGAGIGRTGPLCVPQTGKGTLARIDYARLEGELETPRLDRSAPGKASLAATRWFPSEAREVKSRLSGSDLPVDTAARLARVVAIARAAVEAGVPETGARDDVIAVLAHGKGRPLERADVFVSLARAAGIAARLVHGVRVGQDGTAARAEWIEAYAGAQGWLHVDLDAGTTALAPAELVPILLSEDGELPFAYAGAASVVRVPRPPPPPAPTPPAPPPAPKAPPGPK